MKTRNAPAADTPGVERRAFTVIELLVVLAVVAVSAFVVAYPLISNDSAATHLAVVPPALVAVDPATNRVVASIPVGSKPVSVTAGGGAVFDVKIDDAKFARPQ